MASEEGSSPSGVWQEPNAVQIHVTLEDIAPTIWRRLVVPITGSLSDLHQILQAAMGWTDSHLHQFEIGCLRFGDADILNQDRYEGDAQAFDASEVRLRDFLFHYDSHPTFFYVYDFGDDWRHRVTLEKLLSLMPAPKVATCVEGARCCPPEDVGGPPGYFEFLRVLLTPEPDEIEEQKHLKRWSGGKFDPERFDVAKTDKVVRRAMRKRRVTYP